MKRSVVAALVAGAWLVGCGGGGSLPAGANGPSDGPGALPGDPLNPNPDSPESPDVRQSLWPLTVGSSWTYRITDPVRGTFDKTVEVMGIERVPEMDVTATAMRSIQPHLEELSWQVELDNGTVVRLREEDRKGGALARVTTWSPATVKSLARPQALNWSTASTIRELTRLDDGTQEEKERTYTWRVVAVNETVTVPAGTFTNALKILRDRPDKDGKERIYWLVPGVGKVKEDGERLEELSSYTVQK
ncbi:hypothetical protein [Stigmatella aurantiaca]|uniref:Conserved uncharacterized protein n=1 Tax=Stigmatella aurantiaca (strain DW4/3-1) TaxID=378806 RepID=Q08X58_STIAD|nr:hypothetical protein [Stigmatella aurantiaca]ADO71106.1 conserved uncharacterized protein [Stigmatella aurantiaca DW4/3-1]EAU65083.1 hypothetical protein STIAU_4673 [Stigmatella aurantiaca DW4/3-1]